MNQKHKVYHTVVVKKRYTIQSSNGKFKNTTPYFLLFQFRIFENTISCSLIDNGDLQIRTV